MGTEDILFQKLGKTFPPGTILFREGEQGKEMFVIQTGKVKIFKEIRGEEQVLAILGPGEFFGEMAILNNKPRSASAIVIEESKMLVIDPKTFEMMVKNNTEIAVRMIKKLAQRLQEADDQIESLMLKDANSKVAHFIARMVEKEGKTVPDGTKISVKPDDLALKTTVSKEEITEILSRLEKAKLVRLEPDGIVVFDINKLNKYLEYLTMKEQFGGLE